jgi:hypothetical protein
MCVGPVVPPAEEDPPFVGYVIERDSCVVVAPVVESFPLGLVAGLGFGASGWCEGDAVEVTDEEDACRSAPGVMAGALARGLGVPDDLSIVAVAMSEQAALMSAPAMTTVSVDEREMGRLGVELLISRLEGESGPCTQKLFDGTLQVRGTSGPTGSPTG